jgi:hypothetical protein
MIYLKNYKFTDKHDEWSFEEQISETIEFKKDIYKSWT